MKTIVFLALVAAAAASNFRYQDEFDAWKSKFEKSYESDIIELKRQIIWESNRNFVENHNKNSDKFGFTVEMNGFADLETAEFKEIYNGLIARDQSYKPKALHANVTAPSVATVDWRKKGAVTPIKNQGQCGSCWSFSATGSLEGQHFLKKGELVSLSEQQLMDCSTKFGNHGCKGGLMDLAFEYLATVAGDDTEESYEYRAEDGICRYKVANVGAGTKSHTDVPRGSESALMNAVESVGPISVAIDAGHSSMQLYKEGIYYEPECSSTKLDHGVLAVGYGAEMEKDYWLVKNSWGERWGMEGYIMMSRNRENNCGIATQASYPTEVN